MRMWAVLVFGACTPSNIIEVEAWASRSDSWAVGAEVLVTGRSLVGQQWELAKIETLQLSPDGMANARRLSDESFAITTFEAGTLHVHFNVEGDEGDTDFDLAPTTIGPMRVGVDVGELAALPPVLSPRPTEIGVYAPRHVLLEEPIVDENEHALVGHPIEPWTPQERLLPFESDLHPSRSQFELIPDAVPVAVSVGGETISFVAIPPRSATRLALVDTSTGAMYDSSTTIPVPLTSTFYDGTQLVVLAYDANDRLLVGADLVATAATAVIGTVVVGPSLVLYGNVSGTSSVAITYDGLAATFPVATP